MVQPGRNSPAKEAKVTSQSSPPKWVFRLPNARRKLKRPATPHPVKVGGNSKREALTSLTETGRARKKIVFESEEPAAGINGGTHAHAGAGEVSSPSRDRKGGRWSRKARPGPFEAVHLSMGRFEVEPGTLPLLARDLRFSMGKKDSRARDQPEIVAGTGQPGVAGSRHEDGRPEEKMAVAHEVARSTHVERVASLAALDEDTLQNGDGANLLSESTNLAAPFPEMASHVLANVTCDLSHIKSNLVFEFDDGTSFLDEEASEDGEADLDGKPPAPAPESSPENPPEEDMGQHENVKIQHDKPEFEEDNVAAPPGTQPVPESPLEPAADQPGKETTHPDEPVFGECGNPSAGLDSGGASKPPPATLDVDHAKELGTAGSCEGLPSLTFSNDETKYLADKIGHAIIGKFSHTIPTAQQIQKAFSNIQLIDGFKWKFVNAKHILIQFRDVQDYGRMLNGPNGAPVWFIEHHPMRVFKWTPDFDTSFESPIAVVWCKVIGLPIHLYDQSALIAIGKLLGKPTQVDHATLNQSRLTFARICIEIDISSPPPDEIILNILDKLTRYKVVWDRIPSYCVECKHVGHVQEECRILGRKNPPKKDNNNHGAKPRRDNSRRTHSRREWRPKGSKADASSHQPGHATVSKEMPERGPSEESTEADASPSSKASEVIRVQVDEAGFQLVTRRKKGKMKFPPHHPQEGPHKAPYREVLLMGGNVATVSFGDTDMGIIDPGGSSTLRIS